MKDAPATDAQAQEIRAMVATAAAAEGHPGLR